jgi:hypothetical protein
MEGERETDDIDGGPRGGKGLEESATAPGLMIELQDPWLDAREGGLLYLALHFFSAAASMLGFAIDFLGGDVGAGADWVLVNVRVKNV